MLLKVVFVLFCVLYILIFRGVFFVGNSNSYEFILLFDFVRGLKFVLIFGKICVWFDVFYVFLRIIYSCEFNFLCRMWMWIIVVYGFVGFVDVMLYLVFLMNFI